jgi:hypothetical protein
LFFAVVFTAVLSLLLKKKENISFFSSVGVPGADALRKKSRGPELGFSKHKATNSWIRIQRCMY